MKFANVIVLVFLSAACASNTVTQSFSTVTDPAGCHIEQVTSTAFDSYQVQGVSRNGRYLSYTTNRGEDTDGRQQLAVFILDLVTGSETALPAAINNSGNFSPDGEYLVAAAYDDTGRTEIFELHVKTQAISVIAPHEQWDWIPSYSADGRYVVFNSHRNEDQADVFVYERATENLTRITHYSGYDAHAQFSPDGDHILFHRMHSERDDGGYDFDLFVYDRRFGTETQLTDEPFEESYGAFAPDGQHIVFSSDFEEQAQKLNLYLRAPDGSLTALTDGDWKDSYAFWTRDGRYIYFNSDRNGVTNIYRIAMRGMACVNAH